MLSSKLPNEFRKTFETIWFSQMSNLNKRDDFKTSSNHKQPEIKSTLRNNGYVNCVEESFVDEERWEDESTLVNTVIKKYYK
ncbi:unnamed protein product [Brachionus calyciflorus]|uniref:Uncharacterized protein n=1 Tax=Brachionus calyciflorus TaxID=104777 RepID=A0A813TVJ3_9BILA|nr:unnamed protein product [Brachionus calyciflorus]